MLDLRAGQQSPARLRIILGPHDSVYVFSLYLFHCLFMSVCVKSLANIKIIIVSVILLKWRTINNMHWCVLHHFTLASTKLWWRDLVFSLVLFSWLSFLQVRFTVVDVFPGSFIKTKQYILTGLCLPRKLDLTRSAPTQCCIVIVVVHYSRVNGTSCFCYNSLVLDKLFTLRSERLGNKSSLECPVIYNVLNQFECFNEHL